jgi:hypothetical protein
VILYAIATSLCKQEQQNTLFFLMGHDLALLGCINNTFYEEKRVMQSFGEKDTTRVEKASRPGTREENQGFRRRTFHRLFMYNFLNSFVMLIIIMSN